MRKVKTFKKSNTFKVDEKDFTEKNIVINVEDSEPIETTIIFTTTN